MFLSAAPLPGGPTVCGRIPEVEHANIVKYTDRYVNAVITYHCRPGYTFLDGFSAHGNAKRSVFCSSTGIWVPKITNCIGKKLHIYCCQCTECSSCQIGHTPRKLSFIVLISASKTLSTEDRSSTSLPAPIWTHSRSAQLLQMRRWSCC